MRPNDHPQMFLCSHCLTEQPVSSIGHDKNTLCLCPNCGKVCCQSYCTILKNGRWNIPPANSFLTEDIITESDWQRARAAYNHALEEFYQRYERTRTEYELEILSEAIEKLEDSLEPEE